MMRDADLTEATIEALNLALTSAEKVVGELLLEIKGLEAKVEELEAKLFSRPVEPEPDLASDDPDAALAAEASA